MSKINKLREEKQESQSDRKLWFFVGKNESDHTCQDFKSVKSIESDQSAESAFKGSSGQIAGVNVSAQKSSDGYDGSRA